MHNLHISLTEFRHESRVLKETSSLLSQNLVHSIEIAAIHANGLAQCEALDPQRKLHRLRLISRYLPKKLPFKVIKFAEFCLQVLCCALRQRPHVVNLHTLALLPLGILIKWAFRARLVYDAHELETEVEGLRGVRKMISRSIEGICMPAVDLTITVSPLIRDWYRRKYNITNVVSVLNCPPFKAISQQDRLRKKLGIGANKRICLYQGGLSEGRGIELLLDAFQNSHFENEVLVCMGYGELADEVKRVASTCSRVYYLPAVPFSEVLEYTMSADVGFVLTGITDQECLNNQFCLPNKLFEYAMAGVPIICSPMKEMSSLVNSHGIGVVIDDATPEAVERAVRKIGDLQLQAVRNKLHDFSLYHCWEMQEQALVDAYKQYIFHGEIN